jgi:hypothetical protein
MEPRFNKWGDSMKSILTAAMIAAFAVAIAFAQQPPPAAAGEMILYQKTNYGGDFYMINSSPTSVETKWNIRSISIHEGETWQICAKPRFRGPCIELARSLPDASAVGIEGQIGSARIISGQ